MVSCDRNPRKYWGLDPDPSVLPPKERELCEASGSLKTAELDYFPLDMFSEVAKRLKVAITADTGQGHPLGPGAGMTIPSPTPTSMKSFPYSPPFSYLCVLDLSPISVKISCALCPHGQNKLPAPVFTLPKDTMPHLCLLARPHPLIGRPPPRTAASLLPRPSSRAAIKAFFTSGRSLEPLPLLPLSCFWHSRLRHPSPTQPGSLLKHQSHWATSCSKSFHAFL